MSHNKRVCVDVTALRYAAADYTITVKELAGMFGMSHATLYKALKQHKIERARGKCKSNSAGVPVSEFGGAKEESPFPKQLQEWPVGVRF